MTVVSQPDGAGADPIHHAVSYLGVLENIEPVPDDVVLPEHTEGTSKCNLSLKTAVC